MWTTFVPQIIRELNNITNLPNYGVLAGGALANKIWEKVTGNKAVVNDIDVFYFKSIKSIEDAKLEEHNNYVTVNGSLAVSDKIGYCEDLNYSTKPHTYYKILGTERSHNKMLNSVFIESNLADPQLIIDSFDINCTQVAYDLATGQIYYSDDFQKFLSTGVIETVNANTPSHTLMRLLQKRDDLNALIDLNREVYYLASVDICNVNKNVRRYFSDQYLPKVKKYGNEIKDLGFSFEQEQRLHKFNPNIPVKVFRFRFQNEDYVNFYHSDPKFKKIPYIKSIQGLNFYFKYINGNQKLEKIWEQIGHFWQMGKEYFGTFSSMEILKEVDNINSVIKWVDKCEMMKTSLFDLTLKEQIVTLSNLKQYLTNNRDDVKLLKVCDSKMNFESFEDVEDYFTIMRIKKRKELYQQSVGSVAAY